ncbi:MAG: hypothetical protein MUC83_00895 [Pirellula sp.]|nr:hypothetical protein [Pirellula sp.]
MSREEQIIAVVPGKDSSARLVLVLEANDRDRPIILRSESFSPDVGWFAQSSLRLTRMELSGLRNVLGIPQSKGCSDSSKIISDSSNSEDPRIFSIAAYRRA